MKRRQFGGLILSGIGFSFFPRVISKENVLPDDYPFRSLADAFRSINFDPNKEGHSFFVVTADVHYGSKGTDGMLATIQDVNKMEPSPAFFCVDGDMIVNGSPSFGVVPDPKGRLAAIHEFTAFKKDADLLDPEIRLILALGNHDTNPKEIDPDMFWEVFPGYPPYQSFDQSGIHVIVLNGHSTGYIDSKQMKWLLNDVNTIPKDQTVIVFVHQPSMSHRVNERGIPKAVSKAFENHKGLIWLIGGHEHYNAQKTFQLNKTKLVDHIITCGTANLWGGPERPGYWIYCLRNGEVAGRIFKQRFQGYRTEAEPYLTHAENVPKPFDHLDNILWRVLVGEGDKEYLIYSKANDCLSYWAYVKELTYRIPLGKIAKSGSGIALLCNYSKMQNIRLEGQYFMSIDMKNWQEIKPEKAEFEVISFKIPEVFLQSENVYFKFIPLGEAHVGGFALFQ